MKVISAKTVRKIQRAKRLDKQVHVAMSCSGNVKDEWHKTEKLKKFNSQWKQVSNLPLDKKAVARDIYRNRKNAPKNGEVKIIIPYKVA